MVQDEDWRDRVIDEAIVFSNIFQAKFNQKK